MVRVNVTQNSGMVNFVPEFGAFTIRTNQFRCTEKFPRRPKTGIKDGFKEIELPEIFHWNDPDSRVPSTFQPDFPGSFSKW